MEIATYYHIDKAIKLIQNIIEKYTGNKDWIDIKLKEISNYVPPKNLYKLGHINQEKRFHPLAFLIWKIQKYMEHQEPQSFVPTEDTARLVHLADILFTIKECKNFNTKIKELISDKKELYEKTLYEMQVSCGYKKLGYNVIFAEAIEDTKIPDIYVELNNGQIIEIECKKKDIETERDKKNHAIWRIIRQYISLYMRKKRVNYEFLIKLNYEPTRVEAQKILSIIKSIIDDNKEGNFSFSDGKIEINAIITLEMDKILTNSYYKFTTKDFFDHYIYLDFEKKEDKNGNFYVKNPRLIAYKLPFVPDRYQNVIKSFGKAKKQFSKRNPNLIYIHVNTLTRQMAEDDFSKLELEVKKELNNNRSITGVVLTAEFFFKHQLGIKYEHKSKVILNQDPKNPLPSGFMILGLPKTK